jgi:hypothetical protein
MRRRRTVLAAALAASLAHASFAREAGANGRFPASNGVVFAPSDEATILVRVTFGLLVSHDRGRSWRWICERAIGFSGPEDPSYVVTRSGAIVAALFQGLRVSRDGGCTWQSVPTDATVFVDLTSRGDGAVVALASSYDRAGDAGSLYKTQLWLSTDDARSFAPMGAPIDPTVLGETVDVAPSEPSRVYVSGVRDRSGARDVREGALLVSSNGGSTWTDRALRLEGSELAPYIAAVDPRRAGRVYVRTSASPERPTRLLVTDDAGKTFRTLLTAKGALRGFALSEDGRAVHAGGPDDGLFAGEAGGRPTELVASSALPVQCLAQRGDTLWACAGEASGFVAGTSDLSRDAGAFEARLHLRDVVGPLACGAGTSVASECEVDWRKLKSDLGIGEPGADAAPGASPSERRAGAGAGASTKAGDGGLARSPVAWAVGLLGSLAIGALVLRRLRRSP